MVEAPMSKRYVLRRTRRRLAKAEAAEKILRMQLSDAVYTLAMLQKQYDMQAVFHHRKERDMRGPMRLDTATTNFIPVPVDERTLRVFVAEEYVDLYNLEQRFIDDSEKYIPRKLAQRAVDFLVKEATITVTSDTLGKVPIKRHTMKLWVILPEKNQ